MFSFPRSFLSPCAALLLPACVTTALFAQQSATTDWPQAEEKDELTASVQSDIDRETTEQIDDAGRKILDEAVAAVEQSEKALQALEDGDSVIALDSLERATGKLELILARYPDLALAPSGVNVKSFDLFATREAIEAAIERAEDLLDDGEVQKARKLMQSLASEVIVSVSHIPLATYPAAIKAVAPLIDRGQYDDARRTLRAVLGTIVVMEHVIPLPVLRAEAMLDQAETLAEKSPRSDEENEQLDGLLSGARTQLEMAQLLGYGRKKDFEPLFDELEAIADKTSDGEAGDGFFDAIREGITAFRRRVFG